MVSSKYSLSIRFVIVFIANILCKAASVEVVHLGCFSSRFAESHSYYRIKASLTWKQGSEACTERLTTHMAVMPDSSSPGDYTFFCGNDLLRHSDSVSNSLCQRCGGRYCGGEDTVSLYKLRETTPFSVLIAISRIAVIKVTEDDDVPVLNTMFSLNTKTWDMDYYYEEDEIWFSFRNNTYRSAYNPATSRYITPRKIPTCGDDNRSPVFDWVKKRVYYACADERKIYELDTNGNTIKTYQPKIDRNIRTIAVDPYSRLVFVNVWGERLFAYSLETGHIKEFVKYGKLFVKPTVMATDHHEQYLYIIGQQEGESENVLMKVNYEDTKASLLYKGPELDDVWGMDYFNGTVVWSHIRSSDKLDIAYKCALTPRCEKEDLKVIYSDPKKSLTNLKIYHPLKQTPDTQTLCSLLRCSHTCKRVSLFEARCACPPPMRLTANNRTCNAECPPLRATSLDIRCVYQNRETSCDNGVRHGTVATPTCKPNYRLPSNLHIKQPQVTCLSEGEWSAQPIACSPECGGLGEYDNKISFGAEVERGEVPWQVGLYMRRLPDGTRATRWTQLCGGTLISSHIVLTAAHCVKYGGQKLNAGEVKVGLGKQFKNFHTIEPYSVVLDVRQVLVPPLYLGEATNYIQDIALLDLIRTVSISEYIVPACVDWDNIYKMTTGETVYVAGWGKTEDGVASESLVSTELTYVDTNDCVHQFSHALKQFITPDKFCGQTKNGSQVQQGDSGGGMTAIKDGRHFVVGVVSTKVIKDNKFSLFTNISNLNHIEWLGRQKLILDYYHSNH